MPVYGGKFGKPQAERLLWRAGFGPRRGEAKALAQLTLKDAVRSLTRPPAERLTGPEPTDSHGWPLAPRDAWGHDHLWWLDRMVRSNRPLVERMTLNWHDWFATGDVGASKLGLDQNETLRSRALGGFHDLLLAVTVDPAMLLWLSGNENTKWAPNENYARELMELFTLGAGVGYTEDDVREQARALTGWRNDWQNGPTNFRYDPNRHDTGLKTIFGQRGDFDWRDSCRLCVEHPKHADFFVTKLWSYFVAGPPSSQTLAELGDLYRAKGYAVRPVLEAILMHPDLYEGAPMVKPPVVYIAGMLRAADRGIDTNAWTWVADLCGQQLFQPPNVAGWDESRWVDTATWRGRWLAAVYAVKKGSINPGGEYEHEDDEPERAVKRALKFWGGPSISAETRDELTDFAERCELLADTEWKHTPYRIMRQNALRLLVATSPDFQTS